MKRSTARLLCLAAIGLLATAHVRAAPQADPDSGQWRDVSSIDGLPSRIAFGSCSHQDQPQPVLDTVAERRPDLFIYLGDNIYGDTRDMAELRAKYEKQGSRPEFRRLAAQVPLLAIWDDHDYGWNDAGREYEFRDESRDIFFDFWQVSDVSPRSEHPGIYGVHTFRDGDRALQVILLDTRTFRDPLLRNEGAPPDAAFKNDYRPDSDPAKTLLGGDQWQWLESVLREPADMRLICTSIQFGHEYNGWESWTNLPAEQQRMIDLIRDTQANGVLFISGDVHWAEISRRDVEGLYPLYDVTASGLTEEWHNVEPNRFRVGDAVRENHFGEISIDWSDDDPRLTLRIIDVPGHVRLSHELRLSALQTAPDQ
jgi:alkaline phosphatase D